MANWSLIGYIIRSSYRKKVFLILKIGPIRPSEIARETGLRLTHVTRALRELRKKGLAKCLNPKEKFGRIYDLTPKAKKLKIT
jgi:predicted transcriptional regulator